MKLVDTLRLSCRNLINNASHFVLSLLSIVLLSVLMMTIADFCWIFHVSAEENDVKALNENGLTLNIEALGSFNDPARYVTNSDLADFLDFVEGLGIDGEYNIYDLSKTLNINGSAVSAMPYIGRFKPERRVPITDGEPWSKADEGKPLIWLGASTAETLGASVGGELEIFGYNEPFKIKGIVDDFYSYIDIKNFKPSSVSITDPSPELKDIGEVKALRKAFNDYSSSIKNTGGSNPVKANGNFLESASAEIGGFIYALCAALIAVSIGVCLVCVLRTLQTNIENNNNSLGLMKALGTKNRDMKAYILTQVMLLILVGTAIAMLISCLIGYVALGKPLEILMGMLYTDVAEVSAAAEFWFVLPLLNAVLLGVVVALASIPMLRRYMKIDAIKIINEGNV